MNNEELLNQYFKEKNLSESTCKMYRFSLELFCEINKKSLCEVIREGYVEEYERIPISNRNIKQYLIDFKTYLLNNEISKGCIQLHFRNVLSFFDYYGVEIPKIIQQPKNSDLTQNSPISLVNTLLLFISPSEKDIVPRTVGDFIKATNEYHHGGSVEEVLDDLKDQCIIPKFHLHHHYAFCSAETSRQIVYYLNTRDNLKAEDKLFDIPLSNIIHYFRKISPKLDNTDIINDTGSINSDDLNITCEEYLKNMLVYLGYIEDTK